MSAHYDLTPATRRMAQLVDAVPSDAPLLDRIVGLAGREPGWLPPG